MAGEKSDLKRDVCEKREMKESISDSHLCVARMQAFAMYKRAWVGWVRISLPMSIERALSRQGDLPRELASHICIWKLAELDYLWTGQEEGCYF